MRPKLDRPTRLGRLASFRREILSKQSRWFFLFVSPWIIGFLSLTAWPLLSSAYYSLTFYKIGLPRRFIGLANYEFLLNTDPNFKLALGNSLVYTVLSVPLGIVVALLIATLLNQQVVRGLTFWRTLFYMPAILPAFASALMFQWVFSYRYGPVSNFFRSLGLASPRLMTTDHAQWVIVLFSLWGFGPAMIIFLAALHGVPRVLYEAAAIDGANKVQCFFHVTVPQITPAIFFLFTSGLIGSMQMFQVAWFMATLPKARSIFLGTLVYSAAFRHMGVGTASGMGYASAIAWVIFAMVMVITALNLWGARFWVYYES